MASEDTTMRSVAELIGTSLFGLAPGRKSFEIPREFNQDSVNDVTRRRVERFNAEEGKLNLLDGYDCQICKNRGHTGVIIERDNGVLFDSYPQCRCMAIRNSISRMKMSGLEKSLKRCTFEAFNAENDWQREMIDSAKLYCEEGARDGRWFFVGGAVGAGKTHICTAIAGRLLREMPVHYMTWTSDSTRIKAVINDDEEYALELGRLKNIEALYIDDFFKPVRDASGCVKPPTPADVRLAYEILNHRYINRMVTLISSERYISELMDIDEAVASRIAERAGEYCLTLGRDRSKNHRMKIEELL